MFTYLCLGTNDLQRAIRFYDPVMAALGAKRCVVVDEPDWVGWAGWGTYEDKGARELALWVCPPFDKRAATPGNGSIIALRPQYQPDFYAAYVRDPDGHKLAAVSRGFTSRASA